MTEKSSEIASKFKPNLNVFRSFPQNLCSGRFIAAPQSGNGIPQSSEAVFNVITPFPFQRIMMGSFVLLTVNSKIFIKNLVKQKPKKPTLNFLNTDDLRPQIRRQFLSHLHSFWKITHANFSHTFIVFRIISKSFRFGLKFGEKRQILI